MKIGILGTGGVGQKMGAKLDELGHEVMIGTRDVAATLARTQPAGWGQLVFSDYQSRHPNIQLGTFAEAAAYGEILFNCTSGAVSLDVLALAGADNLGDKVLVDIANPLDYSGGMVSLIVCNTDSLGEQIQRAYPRVKVVKTLNTMTGDVMVNPELVPGDHVVFVSGDNADAKATVTEILRRWLGWRIVLDLGGIKTARNVEMLLPIWVQLMGVVGTPYFNFNIAK